MVILLNFIRSFKISYVEHCLQALFALCIEYNIIPASWTEARITLLPKPGKVLSQPEDYRPVLLLNVDYKNLTTI